MTQEISQLVVQVKSDGIAPATTGLEGLAVAGSKAEAGVIKAREAMDKLSVTSQNVSKSASNLMIQQQKQVDIFGQSREFVNAYTATLKGLSETQIANSAALGAQADQQKAALSAQKQAETQTLALARANEVLSASIVEATALEKLRVAAEMSTVRNTGTSWAEQAAMRASKSVSQGSVNSGKYSSATQSVISAQNFNMNPLNDSGVAAAKQIKVLEDQANAVKKLEADYVAVTRALDPYAVKLINLDNQLDTVTKAHKAGLSSVQDFRTDVAKIDASKVSVLAKELKSAEKATHDAADGMQGFSMASSRAKSELIVMIRELMRGDFTRLAGSMSIFTQVTGTMGAVMAVVLNPITWVVGAVAGLGIAALAGSSEMTKFNSTMIQTGGYASMTSDQFSNLSKELGKIGSEGQHSAAAALTEIASTGKFTATQLGVVGKAAIEMQESTGQAVAATAKEFEKLKDEPVKASLELTGKYHYLTVAVFEQIRALEEQGKHMEAGNLAINAMADSVAERTPKEVAAIGLLETAWNKVKQATVGALNATFAIGRDKTATEQIDAITAKISMNTTTSKNRLGGDGKVDRATDSQNRELLQQIADIQKHQAAADIANTVTGNNADLNDRAVKATGRAQDRMESISKESKLQKALNVLKREYLDMNAGTGVKSELLKGVSFGPSGDTPSGGAYDKAKQAEIDKYTPKERKPRSNEYAIDGALKVQEGLMNDEKQALSQHLKDIKNLYDIGEIDGQQFLANTISAKEQSLSKQYEIAQKEYQIASDKKNPSAMQDRANQMKKIQAEMYNDAVQYSNDATALAKNQQAVVDSYADKIVKAAEIQQEALQNTIAKSTLGDKQAAQYDQLLKLKKEYISAIAALDDKHNNKNGPNALTDKQYSDMKASAKQGYEDSIDAQKKTNDTLDAIQDDWYAGALKAYANYRDNAASVASQTQTAFTSAFQSMENALVTFVTTGKLDFKSLATSILADLDRIIIKQQLAAAYKSATSAGGLGDILGNAFGISSLTNSGILNNSGILGMGGDGTAGAGFGLASGWSGAASIIPSFADGGSFTNGVVTRPTNFSTSQMGEAGPEAIMPLAKMSDGSLGIKQSGTSDASKTTPDTQSTNGYTTIHVHVTGTTAPDVRRSAGQGAREALSIMSGAQRYV